MTIIQLPLSNGLIATIDEPDLPLVDGYRWHGYEVKPRHFYCMAYRGRRTIYMHRLILNPPPGMVVDHRDGNGLNNSRANIRVCTIQQNNWNSRRGNQTGFKGVKALSRSFVAKIGAAGTPSFRRLGTYATPEEAAHAYDREAILRHGDFASLNFSK